MEMTDAEMQELIFLRDSISALKKEKQKIESKLATRRLEIDYLDKWKKGRWFGCVFLFFILCIVVAVMLPDALIFLGVKDGNNEETTLYSYTVTQLSGATMIFGALLTTAVLLMNIYFAFKLIAEVGNSGFAQKLSIMFGWKNYYRAMEVALQNKRDVECELGKILEEYDKIYSRLDYLEIKYECEMKKNNKK